MANVIASRFEDATVIVTGAGSGIGKATALRLLDEGARVVAADISSERLALLAHPRTTHLVRVTADISSSDGIDSVVAAAGARVDGLINNAGIMDGFLSPIEVDDATWQRVLSVNLEAPMRLTRAVLPAMVAAGRGVIVNVSSEAGLRGGAAGAAYTASKHALIGYTRSVAVFHGAQGIRCNAVAPGAVATNVDGSFRSELGQAVLGPILKTLVSKVATADELAGVITFLLSDDASNVNGSVVACDAGWSAV